MAAFATDVGFSLSLRISFQSREKGEPPQCRIQAVSPAWKEVMICRLLQMKQQIRHVQIVCEYYLFLRCKWRAAAGASALLLPNRVFPAAP